MEPLSLALDLTFRIKTQTDLWRQGNRKLRQLSLQAQALSEDIREQFAGIDSAVLVSGTFSDALSRLELTLSKILRLIEKEKSRNAFKRWITAGDSADLCAELTSELATISRSFSLAAQVHIYSQTKVISLQHENMAQRQEDLIDAVTKFISKEGPSVAVVKTTRIESMTMAASSSHYSDEESDDFHILSFIECCFGISPSADDEISLSLQDALTFFIRHVVIVHSGTSVCYAATESFVIEHQSETKALGCVAVLKAQFDLSPNFDDRAGNLARCKNDMIFQFSLRPVPNLNSPPSDWVQVQVMADGFNEERVCFALWDLGRLPPASHLPDSESFRWLKQSLSTVRTERGLRNVVDIESGSSSNPFRRFHQLNARIAHPSNATHRISLVAQMDQEIRVVCEETWEEWYICLLTQYSATRTHYLHAHYTYARRSMELEIEAFKDMNRHIPLSATSSSASSTSETSSMLASSASSSSDSASLPQVDQPSTFDELQANAFKALEELFQPLLNPKSGSSGNTKPQPTPEHLQLARVVGRTWWKIHTSIVLLNPEEREKSSEYTRIPLGAARQEIAKQKPALIWNYLPPHLAAQARHKRKQLLLAKPEVLAEVQAVC